MDFIVPIAKHPLCNDAKDRGLRALPIDEVLILRLETSFGRLQAQGDALATRFYERLFAAAPAVRALFPADLADQKRKLMLTLSFLIASLRKPEQVRTAMRELGARHVSYGARPEHYPIVCDMLVATMAELHGDLWTAELESDWRGALQLVADLMRAGAEAQA